MITPRPIRERFVAIEAYLSFVRERARETLFGFAEPRGYAVIARTKSLESLAEKIESGRYSSWMEIDDLVACTVVTAKLSDENEVLEFLKRSFVEWRTYNRGSTKKAPDTFRFDCTRFVGRLYRPEDVSPLEPAYNLLFEVQIRTAFEHAWSVATHDLTYKNAEVSWERLRLAAQLKATVEQLDMLVAGFQDSAKFIAQSSWPEIDARKVTVAYFQELFDQGKLVAELKPKDWTRFAENVSNVLRSSPLLRNDPPKSRTQKMMNAITDALNNGVIPPLSISLLQLVFSVLVTKNVIAPPFNNYVPIVTEEMELFFPTLKAISHRFAFEPKGEQ